MEINKQLFEDVLSGKLKGIFVFRDGKKTKSKYLRKNTCGEFCYCFTNAIYPFTCNGYVRIQNIPDEDDVINFIPDIDMKENELTIEIPDGKIVDWDESKKQNKIVLKDKQLTYVKVCKELFGRDYYFIDQDGSIEHIFISNESTVSDKNNASTKHQLECILAKNQLATVAKYLNNGWKPNGYIFGWFICACGEELEIRDRNDYKFNNNIIFKSKELAQKAIEILGEETVKLALKPLGI